MTTPMKKTTLQATGFGPYVCEHHRSYMATEYIEGDRRGVSVEFFEAQLGWVAAVTYLTTWGIERPFTLLYGHEAYKTLNQISGFVRSIATDMLPPGAGYPATPQYETRQSKLRGMMQTITLVALSKVLAEIHKDELP